MHKLVLVSVAALTVALCGSGMAQEIKVIPGVAEAQANAGNNPPSWQAICGYKWRQYRAATGASGRDAYIAFMRTPSAEGGCGAGETTRTRPVAVRPLDDKIKEYIDKLAADKAARDVKPAQ